MGSYKEISNTAQIRLVSSHNEVYEPCDDSFVLVDALLADHTNMLLKVLSLLGLEGKMEGA
ncbi:hypothetical protein PIB30_051970 [Stylosanthes scabra]|uniref:Uncharacterized protein n=1 Tax=Stylosanthes scabra TaxID=79078 RepID=A0ABU6QJT2_9FABA|nr:hypothetical protein [Stylosanthes scabra]